MPGKSTKKSIKITEKGNSLKEEEVVSVQEEKQVTSEDKELETALNDLSSEGEDSSDDEAILKEIEDEDQEFDKKASKTPLLRPEDSAQITKKIQSAKKAIVAAKDKSEVGVIYLGRIPHGFYEEEMESYFSQFGQVSRLRLSRNKKVWFFSPLDRFPSDDSLMIFIFVNVLDWQIQTLCIHWICIQRGCKNCCRDNGQLPAHESPASVQIYGAGAGPRESVQRSQQEV